MGEPMKISIEVAVKNYLSRLRFEEQSTLIFMGLEARYIRRPLKSSLLFFKPEEQYALASCEEELGRDSKAPIILLTSWLGRGKF